MGGEGSPEGDERLVAIRNDIKALKEQIETLQKGKAESD